METLARTPSFQVLQQTLDTADASNYAGYSKFDALLSPFLRRISFGNALLRLLWTQLVMRAPINIRPILGVPISVNPETPALFARANLDLFSVTGDVACIDRATGCLAWLVEHHANLNGEYAGTCWGYQHPWQSPGFFQPANSPNCYITVVCAEAFLHGYRVTGNQAYREVAHRAAEFIRTELPVLMEDGERKCIGYVPQMKHSMQVININALASSLFAQLYHIEKNETFFIEAQKLMKFVVSHQTPYGAWFYTTEPHKTLIEHDNYHTGMILDSLKMYADSTGDQSFRVPSRKGIEYYRENLFLPDGAPRWTNSKIWPKDTHGSAQGILTFSLYNQIPFAEHLAQWVIAEMYRGDGSFSYQQRRWWKKTFSLMHWCNGWMVRGLAALIAAKNQNSGDYHDKTVRA